jgi:hypothetical protein
MSKEIQENTHMVPTTEELEVGMKNLKNNKVPETDVIHAELKKMACISKNNFEHHAVITDLHLLPKDSSFPYEFNVRCCMTYSVSDN